MKDLSELTLVDCEGRISHRLTLELDGTVRIAFTGGRAVRVDPVARRVLTPGASIPEGLMDQAAAMRPW